MDATGGFNAAFEAETRAWFAATFGAPTAAQTEAWSAIARGDHTLVVAPTGSGKTLAAFLWAIDQMLARPADGDRRTRDVGPGVVYISPLKALGVDVERNLRAPLAGITTLVRTAGDTATPPTVGIRTGDTPASERRRLVRSPPDILITTPESLYLLLTSAARETLRGVHTVIVDEIHSVAAGKRGAHLAVSLERLDTLRGRPAQRIGLSATVRPVAEIARFLGGRAPVTVVEPPTVKTREITVRVPVDDMTDLAGGATHRGADDDGDDPAGPTAHGRPAGHGTGRSQSRGGMWPHVEEAIVDLVLAHRSTLVFVNSRRQAEMLTTRLNELAAARSDPTYRPAATRPPAAFMGASGSGRPDGGIGGETDGTAHHGAGPFARAHHGAGPFARAHHGAGPFARAHHGSVSKEERADVERSLKDGRLACVVATSSLELGIDMGAIDLVVQVGAPPSVAAGLQRIGRAGHGVGHLSRGILFPLHRLDLLHCAVLAERMDAGAIEHLTVVANPLDVLAQHTVAATAVADVSVDEWFATVRRAAPFHDLPRPAFDSVIDLVSGHYPSDDFAELRPRVTHDRSAGVLRGRPGALRLAVTNGGTIPDRGLFPVHLAGTDTDSTGGTGPGRGPRRVGELDEEMVYESRVGDVFALGTASWRIEEITHERVIVTPAPGAVGRLPFWIGDEPGRPAELGVAMGRALARLAAAPPRADEKDTPARVDRADAPTSPPASGRLDALAAANLNALIADQRAATGLVPTDIDLVVERFGDHAGNWRVVLHSPYGRRVHGPWAQAVTAHIVAATGVEPMAVVSDDGIVLTIPVGDGPPPGPELFTLPPAGAEMAVTARVVDSALFAARFRECAARALLLPRRDPTRRTPLWQQRQRAAHLLGVAGRHPEFPIVIEAARECLRDEYDLPGLVDLLGRIEGGEVRLHAVETPVPSPFAAHLLFRYIGAFVYEDTWPVAERRAAALSIDTDLLASVLGRTVLRDVLDADVIAAVVAETQCLVPGRRARDAEELHEVLRLLGPLDADALAARTEGSPTQVTEWVAQLTATGRIVAVRWRAGVRHAVVEDCARLRDGLGIALPAGVPAALLGAVPGAVDDLVSRYARTHGPFTVADVTAELGLGAAPVRASLARLAANGRVIDGEFLPGGSATAPGPVHGAAPRPPEPAPGAPGRESGEYCEVSVLERIRTRSLAAARRETRAVTGGDYARFLLARHGIGVDAADPDALHGLDGLRETVDRLAGVPLPASAWETVVLPARVVDYSPELLDALLAEGSVVWTGHGRIGDRDGWVALHPADLVAATIRPPSETAAPEGGPTRRPAADKTVADGPGDGAANCAAGRLRMRLDGGGAFLFRALADGTRPEGMARARWDAEVAGALWDLVWAGQVTSDSFAALRAHVAGAVSAGGTTTPRPVRGGGPGRRGRRPAYGRSALRRSGHGGLGAPASPATAANVLGRWEASPHPEADATLRLHAAAEVLLHRHGIVTRRAVTAEDVPGGFGAVYRLLRHLEDAGRCRRGVFVEGLGPAQFAAAAAVDELRAVAGTGHREDAGGAGGAAAGGTDRAVVLAACDPANPYGAALGWPEARGPRPARRARALVVLVDGIATLYRAGGTVTLLGAAGRAGDDSVPAAVDNHGVSLLEGALRALAVHPASRALGPIRQIGDEAALSCGFLTHFVAAGFRKHPRGLVSPVCY